MARPDQRPPIEDEDHEDFVDWNIWLFIGGRGAGKTRAGAEWVRERALGLHDGAGDKPPVNIALVGPTYAEARSVMVEGVSGILSLNWSDGDRPMFESSRRLITWAERLAGADIYRRGARRPARSAVSCRLVR